MVTNFEFATAARILFGAGRARELVASAEEFGRRVLVVTGSHPDRTQWLFDALRAQHFAVTSFSVAGEPTIALVLSGAERARSASCEFIVAIGGGSVLDAGKAIAALATNPGDPLDYLEVIGKAQPLIVPPLPVIAVPTTAGTGAEVTRNAVLHSPEHRVKVSLRHALLLPRLALVDPELTHDLPPAISASTGLDALTQLIEPFVGKRANPVTDALCRAAIPCAARSLRRVCQEPGDASARSDMAFASLCGGLALANAGLGAVHGFAAAIGGMFAAPHGAVCAALLRDVLAVNIAVARETSDSERSRRFDEIARLVTLQDSARAEQGVEWIRELCRGLAIPRLTDFGIQRGHFADIAGRAAVSSSMKGNPFPLRHEQLTEILERAW